MEILSWTHQFRPLLGTFLQVLAMLFQCSAINATVLTGLA